jgi:hypothetical protein
MLVQKKYIFQIDADEFPTETLLKKLKAFFYFHPFDDCFYVPRVNTVDEIRDSYMRPL